MKRVCDVSAIALIVGYLALVQPAFAQNARDDPAPESARLTHFPSELGRNFLTLFSQDNLVPALVGAAAGSAVIGADDSIVRFFNKEGRWDGFDAVGRELGKSQVIGPAIGVSLLVSRMSHNEEFRELSYSLAQGFIVINMATGGLKKLTRRNRPDRSSFNSFPSGHTSNSFTWATIAQRRYGWKVGAPAYAVATYVATSRLQSGKHHLTDIVAGATLGYIVGRTVSRNRTRQRDRRWGRRRAANWGYGSGWGRRRPSYQGSKEAFRIHISKECTHAKCLFPPIRSAASAGGSDRRSFSFLPE